MSDGDLKEIWNKGFGITVEEDYFTFLPPSLRLPFLYRLFLKRREGADGWDRAPQIKLDRKGKSWWKLSKRVGETTQVEIQLWCELFVKGIRKRVTNIPRREINKIEILRQASATWRSRALCDIWGSCHAIKTVLVCTNAHEIHSSSSSLLCQL